MIELISIFASALTLLIIIMCALLMYRVLIRYMSLSRQNSPSITVQTSSNHEPHGETIERAGYVFFPVPEDKKSLFADAMQGFKDFAKLKGYNVDCSIDASIPSKIGVRFLILDEGVTVSTSRVRDDVRDYLDRVTNGDDFCDMPIVVDPIERQQLTSALQSRMAFLRSQAEFQATRAAFYEGLLAQWNNVNRTPIVYQPNMQLTFQQEGNRMVGDSYRADQSANVAQGKGATALNTGTIRIGVTHTERNSQIASLRALKDALNDADLPVDKKAKASRHLDNAVEELEDSESPKAESIAGWLEKAKQTLAGVTLGAEVAEKLDSALEAFGFK